MARQFLSGLTSIVLLALNVSPTGAQRRPANPSQLEAGARVTGVTFSHEKVTMTRGDSVTLTMTFRDSEGNVVDGALWFAFANVRYRPLRDREQPTVLVWSNRPADAQLYVLMRVPRDSGSFRGIPGINLIDSIAVRVSDWPMARVEIIESKYRPYAGTTFKMSAKALTTHDTEHATATITWSSEDPSVASITPSGVLTLTRPGRTTLIATTEGDTSDQLSLGVIENPVRQLDISPKILETRTGDVEHFEIRALDRRGRVVEGIALSYSVHGLDSAGAIIHDDGAFVAENPGAYRVIVTAGGLASEALVQAEARPKPTRVELVGRGPRADVATSDLWVFEGNDGNDYAYTGTHAEGGGQRMFVWDVTDPENVVLVDSVVVDARVVNDVKVNGDATWAIITREGASTRRNGIVVLDLSDPAHPKVVAELTDSLTAGIHNVWINGDVVYAVNDGTSALHIIDMRYPQNPRHVGRWEIRPGESDKTLHDVWSDGRYAYLSYWDDGLVILDVGAGTHGGTPTEPKFVSSYAYPIGNTHVAWREGNYVFLGDEIFGCAECINGPRGYIHVVDVSDIDNPTEVARYEVPEAGTHNIWVENGVLYIAYYQGGLRIVDVSGELRGNLYRQGREIGWYHTAGSEDEAITPNSPMAWGPQPFKGNVFVSDMRSGLWVLRHQRPAHLSP